MGQEVEWVQSLEWHPGLKWMARQIGQAGRGSLSTKPWMTAEAYQPWGPKFWQTAHDIDFKLDWSPQYCPRWCAWAVAWQDGGAGRGWVSSKPWMPARAYQPWGPKFWQTAHDIDFKLDWLPQYCPRWCAWAVAWQDVGAGRGWVSQKAQRPAATPRHWRPRSGWTAPGSCPAAWVAVWPWGWSQAARRLGVGCHSGSGGLGEGTPQSRRGQVLQAKKRAGN